MPRARDTTPVDPALVEGLADLESLDAIVDGAELERVRLHGARFDMEVRRLSLDTVRCDGLRIPGARLANLRAQLTWWEECDLSNCAADEAALQHAVLRHGRLTGLALTQSSLRDVLFENCKLDLANFRFTRLERVVFRGCVLADADFANSTQRDCRYQDCDLRAAQFFQAKLEGVDLRGSRLEGIGGLATMRGARISNEQLLEVAPALAAQLGIEVVD